MAAYTAASRKNGKKYIPLIKNATQLYVIEKGALCGVVLDGSYNLTEANYKTSLQNMVDRVLITDKDGNQIGVVEDTAAQQKYGVVQTVYKQEDGKDAQTEAMALLQTLERKRHRLSGGQPGGQRLCTDCPGNHHWAVRQVLH